MNYYEVSPTKIVRANSDTLTYASHEKIAIGTIVEIPVGSKSLIGVIMTLTEKPAYTTKEIIRIVETEPLPTQLLTLAKWLAHYYATPLATVWQSILPSGLTTKRREQSSSATIPVRDRTTFLLNKDQSVAVEAIDSHPGTHLLHGVTGSGKTAVYIELARRSLDRHMSAIILVPEIALTSQLVDEFTHHFPGKIVLTHSKQTPAQRHRVWRQCLTDTSPIVVLGPRSALFMPLRKLGIIVIDEAHEPSYKQDKSPRYNALRAASQLASSHRIPLVLGSATPSIIDYYLAKEQNKIISLPNAARKPAPAKLTIVDSTKREEFKKHRFLSEKLLSGIERTLASQHQVLIFHNRRGSASVSLCDSCGWQAGCPTCIIPLTLHADVHVLRCHACGYSATIPTSCPQCHSTNIIHKGIGTKLLESELQRLFPRATIARFDTDTDTESTLDKRYAEIYKGNIDIVIGTQGIAKGLDLPKLRLVGVPQADAGLHLPDYTSSERTFQLLSQVVGRVGRYDHPTEVIMQSYHPSHPAIVAGLAQDYRAFYDYTLPFRKRGFFPPYCYLLKLTVTYKTESMAIQNCKKFASTIASRFSDVHISPPSPAFYERVPSGYRWQLLIKSSKRQVLLDIAQQLPTGNHWQYDLDPASLL